MPQKNNITVLEKIIIYTDQYMYRFQNMRSKSSTLNQYQCIVDPPKGRHLPSPAAINKIQ